MVVGYYADRVYARARAQDTRRNPAADRVCSRHRKAISAAGILDRDAADAEREGPGRNLAASISAQDRRCLPVGVGDEVARRLRERSRFRVHGSQVARGGRSRGLRCAALRPCIGQAFRRVFLGSALGRIRTSDTGFRKAPPPLVRRPVERYESILSSVGQNRKSLLPCRLSQPVIQTYKLGSARSAITPEKSRA